MAEGSRTRISESDDAGGWRRLAQRVAGGLERHGDRCGEVVEALLAALDRTASGRRRLDKAAVGSVRAERQRAAVRLVEAALGLRLLDLGFDLRLEVLGPQGRRCDFLASRGGRSLAIHVKQMPPAASTAPFTGRERSLEAIRRPVAVAVRRHPMSETCWANLLPELRRFLEQASVGEEQRHHDGEGGELVWARILGPVPGEQLRMIAVGSGELDVRVARVGRLLRRAHGQFLAEHPNLILFGTLETRPAAASLYAIESALFGTQVERWDRFPRRGNRVAHGRADDGFWFGRRHDRSHVAGWFSASSTGVEGPGGWWDRDGEPTRTNGAIEVDPEVRDWLDLLLGPRQPTIGL